MIAKVGFSAVPAIVLSLIWIELCKSHAVSNDILSTKTLMNTLVSRASSMSDLQLIITSQFGRLWTAIFPVVLFFCIKTKGQEDSIFTSRTILIFSLIYSVALFNVYLITPHDLNWHLATSVKRTMIPVFLCWLYCFFALNFNRCNVIKA